VINTYGKLPRGERKIRIQNSNNYNKGFFKNVLETLPLAEGVSMISVVRDFLFSDNNKVPKNEIPVVKTDIKNITVSSPSIIWFGHSSYMIIIDNKKFWWTPCLAAMPHPLVCLQKNLKEPNFINPKILEK
jgi:hypothetical protein